MAGLRLITVLLVCVAAISGAPSDKYLEKRNIRVEEDAVLTTPGLIKKYGYPHEVHKVTTEDGYILEMHRIPYGKASPASPNKPAVLLMHGMMSSSSDWVIMGTVDGLAYILADLGYDVWLGNSRGNTYSRAHTTLDPDAEDGAFWNFSWHDMGWYDITAEIDYILSNSRQEKLFYIGHSQGTTQFYVMASERPEYNDKITAMFSLAPVAYMHNVENPLFQLIVSANENLDLNLEHLIGIHEFAPHSDLLTELGDVACRDEAATQIICEGIIFLICGFDSEQLNETMIPIIVAHTPAGGSTKQLFHYSQEVLIPKFQQFDYNVTGNMGEYGSEEPPSYDISKITCPVSLHYSSNDWLSAVVDVEIFYAQLPNPIGKFLVPFPKFNHLDFLWAIDVRELLYDQLTELMAGFL